MTELSEKSTYQFTHDKTPTNPKELSLVPQKALWSRAGISVISDEIFKSNCERTRMMELGNLMF